MRPSEMDFSSYPIKKQQSPNGETYKTPQPATHSWRIDYTDSNGTARWEYVQFEHSSPVTEIPANEIINVEKRFLKAESVTGVKFGMFWYQEEPNGEWIQYKPNDKDPRTNIWLEGDYTRKYFEEWRPKAYDGIFDPFKIRRSYNPLEAERRASVEKDKRIKELEAQVLAERNNVKFVKDEATKAVAAERAKLPGNK